MNTDSQEPTVESSSEPTSARLITTLGLAGLISGLILVGAYELTLPLIQANQAQALQEAVFKVLPGIERMQEMAATDGGLSRRRKRARMLRKSSMRDTTPRTSFWATPSRQRARASKTRSSSFTATNRMSASSSEWRSSRVGKLPVWETRSSRIQTFRESFSSLAVDPEIVPVAPGTKSSPNEIDTITGATISSKAVVKIINAANGEWLPRLEGPASQVPETQEPAKDDSAVKQEQQEER